MLTIITPCFNIIQNWRKERFEKMMKSIQNQTYRNFEHIIIDWWSKDWTLEILKRHKKKWYITKLISEKDNGIYQAINKGIKLAKWKYINIMNTDDYFTDSDFFKDSIAILENSQFDFTHADKIIKSRENKPDSIKRWNEKVAFFRMPFRHQTMIVKKSIFDEIWLFDEKLKIASDYKFILKMLLSEKKGYYIPKVFVCSLDWWMSSNRKLCIKEVSKVIYDSYGKLYKLSPKNCEDIYKQKISFWLLIKICFRVKNRKIKKSLLRIFLNICKL